MTNATSQIINPSADWTLILKNVLFAGKYVTNAIVSLLLSIGVPTDEVLISKIGIVVSLVVIYIVMAFVEKLKPIVKILIVIVLGWICLGFFIS